MKYSYCLICKSTTDLTKHHVIPTSITKHLNYTYKPEDIVCLCTNCHVQFHKSELQRLNSICKEFGKSISELTKEALSNDLEKIRRKITALHKPGLPIQVKLNYIREIKEVFNDFDINNLDYFISICVANKTKFSVEKYLTTNVNITKLETSYREYFNKYVSKRIK